MTRIRFPDCRHSRISARPEKVLLLCYYEPKGVSTVPENVAFFQDLSDFPVTVINLCEHRQSLDGLELPPTFNINRYSAIVIHNTVSYNIDNLRSIDRLLPVKLKDYDGVKILLKQDENYRFREIASYIGEIGFDVVFTCLPEEEIEKVYPRAIVGRVKFIRMLTGYVTPTLREFRSDNQNRPIDIGYRGSIQPLDFGRLAFEKRKIGDDVNALLRDSGLRLDISNRWEDRIGGIGWLNFLSSCKATLGAESGASVFDLDGDLEVRCKGAIVKLGEFSPAHEYAESYLKFLSDIEGNVKYNQISPRHFEAIATRTLQILYPGEYSSIIKPGLHYLSLSRDYRNIDEVLSCVLDDSRRVEITSRAYEEILLNRNNWIESFIETVDVEISGFIDKKGGPGTSIRTRTGPSTNVLLLAAHEPRIDPRLSWIADFAPEAIKVHQFGQFGVAASNCEGGVAKLLPNGALYSSMPKRSIQKCEMIDWISIANGDPVSLEAIHELIFFDFALSLSPEAFAELFGAPISSERIPHFRWYLGHFLDTAATLLESCGNISGAHAIVATDLDTLLPSLIISRFYNVPLFYDAHEYWPEADVNSQQFEMEYWISLEKRFVRHAHYRQTVSPGLAEFMTTQYGAPFHCLPNAVPLVPQSSQTSIIFDEVCASAGCVFLFQGGFAEGRGLELLVEAWADTASNALLYLRGRDNTYKDSLVQASIRNGTYNRKVFFPDPVEENQLIQAASNAAVGICPYPPTNILYENCSPNKVSQYMAAGIPILANRTRFVSEIVTEAECGIVLDFSLRLELVAAVNSLAADPEQRSKLGKSGHEYFFRNFNWQAKSGGFYHALQSGLATSEEFVVYSTTRIPSYSMDSGVSAGTMVEAASIDVTSAKQYRLSSQRLRRILRPLWKALPARVRRKVIDIILTSNS
jgi:glycosyltransferase involved in cell wall biosynthesis